MRHGMRRVGVGALLLLFASTLVASTREAASAPKVRVDHVQVESFDGTVLDGWVLRPANAGTKEKLPIVLWTSPYFGTTYPPGDDPQLWTNDNSAFAVPVNLLIENRYAVAIFNVRGSGESGGCFDWFGRREQRDQAFLVEWLAARPWSNERVGMMGLSYHGTTPWEAAIQNPPHLRTIVVAGMISDAYLFTHSPQGATFAVASGFTAQFFGLTSAAPPTLLGAPDPRAIATWAGVAPERICPDVLTFLTDDTLGLTTDRAEAFWKARRLIDGFPKINASVLLTHGFQDLWVSGHQSQESEVWPLLRAPKAEIKGQWGHEFPNFNSFNGDAMRGWNARLMVWLDHYLKGLGPKPSDLGTVSYQDGTGRWRRSTAWPPKEARKEVLYLAGERLSPRPSTDDTGFRSLPRSPEHVDSLRASCAEAGLPDELAAGRVFMTPPLRRPLVIAGNPFAYLTLTADQPGGQVGLHLVDVGPDLSCSPVPYSDGSRAISSGTADLRYFQGNYAARDFPTGRPVRVRIDLTHLAEEIPRGHRLAIVVSRGDLIDRISAPFAPHVTVDGASELVLPLVEGTLGGRGPSHSYPPRPFLPKR
jgi:uncharacterized protein